MTLALADIKARPRQEVTFTIECSGNHGLPFFIGGIGNAHWAGTPLAPILKDAGVLDSGIVAVVRSPDSKLLVDAARALFDGGIHVIEITMTVPNALEVLRANGQRATMQPEREESARERPKREGAREPSKREPPAQEEPRKEESPSFFSGFPPFPFFSSPSTPPEAEKPDNTKPEAAPPRQRARARPRDETTSPTDTNNLTLVHCFGATGVQVAVHVAAEAPEPVEPRSA